MPWKVMRNFGSCRGYAVVKESNLEISGCHETLDAAQAQIKALYASEGEMKSTGSSGASAGAITNEITPNKKPQNIKPEEETMKQMGDGQVFYDNLPEDEQKLADALLELVAEIGYLDEADGIYVGYVDGSRNDNLAMNIKCGTCALHVTDNKCSIIGGEIEENGLCRFAVIPYEYANSIMENNHHGGEMEKEKYNEMARRRMARAGTAMEDGSFPIADREDLQNALQSVGRAKNYSAARAHIIRRARSMRMDSMLPDEWKSVAKRNVQIDELESRLSGKI